MNSAYQTHDSSRTRKHRHHWAYVWIPLLTSFMWFSTVLALLITWLAQGRPHYVSMSDGQTIAYISDVAADILKPLFIVGCVFTAVGFFLSLFIERWLRHSGRLLPEHQKRERVMSALACFGAALGGCGLILLSIFDTKRHPSIHRLFLLIFVLGVALSAIFTVIEVLPLLTPLVTPTNRLWVSSSAGSTKTLAKTSPISKELTSSKPSSRDSSSSSPSRSPSASTEPKTPPRSSNGPSPSVTPSTY
ncbi:hypothetical protein FRB93_002593 [Tulasnella sp. JGI-2019a]|nr:hypothetical protein FRB93_002593 [Tulasnella sp. JGI-2019a]